MDHIVFLCLAVLIIILHNNIYVIGIEEQKEFTKLSNIKVKINNLKQLNKNNKIRLQSHLKKRQITFPFNLPVNNTVPSLQNVFGNMCGILICCNPYPYVGGFPFLDFGFGGYAGFGGFGAPFGFLGGGLGGGFGGGIFG